MDQIVYEGTEKVTTKRVKYEGTDTLNAGDCLCYNRDYGTASAADADRVWRVEKPASGNLAWFAGVVTEKSAGRTGPCTVEIYVPTARAQAVPVRNDQNSTINSTLLTVVPGQYQAGGAGEGRVIAQAIQTVDRSSTTGTTLAVFRGLPDALGEVVTASSRTAVQLPTAAIWDNFDLNLLRTNPFAGSLLETDFRRPIGALSTGQTAVNSGDIFGDGATEMIRTAPGAGIGTCILTAGTANKQIAWRPPCPIVVSGAAGVAGAPWAFEVRVAFGTVTDGDYAGAFLGLLDGDYLMAGDELVDTTGAIIDKGAIGFNILAGDGNAVLRSYKNEGQAVQATAAVKAPVAGTFTTLGMYYNGTTIACYVDGVVNATGLITNANIIEATPLFPQGEELNPFFGFKELAAESNTMTLDWIRVAQLG